MRLLVSLLIISLTLTVRAAPNQDTAALLASLSLEQKVGQMFVVGLYGDTLNAPGRVFLETWQPGGVVLFVSNVGTPDAVTRLTNSWQQTITDAGGVPLLIATDQEGGVIARLKDGFTQFPVPMLLTASGDVDLAYRTGGALATELRAVGINMNLAPVADLYTNLRNPIIGRRSFGSDPERTGRILAGVIRGMQAGGVLATAKHFPGHGDTDRDSHTSLPIVQYPLDELQQVEFAPFRWTIAAGVEAMMVAHIWYPALDAEPLPASLSGNVVTGLLRTQMDFRGLVMTDAIEMDAIDTEYGYGQASVMAIQAGVDIIAFGAHLSPDTQAQAIQTVIDAVRSGDLSAAQIDTAAGRVLDAKARYGILDWQPLDPATASERVQAEAHADLVGELFRAGVTVAYDRADLLPLEAARRVLLVYPATRPQIKRECTPLHPGDQTQWAGVSDAPSEDESAFAVRAAADADTVVVFTQNAGDSAEQQALVNALPADKTVVVALFSPYDWQAFPDVAAYVTTYSPLDPGISAVCEVLFGVIPARGQLPVALDGQRDFASFIATEGIVINAGNVAMAARITATALPTLTPLPPTATLGSTLAPSSTPTITATRLPLLSSTRVIAAAPPPNAEAVPSAPAVPDLSLAAVIVTPGAGVDASLLVGVGALGTAACLYARLFAAGQRTARLYRGGFPVTRCPACGTGTLSVKAHTRRLMGLAYQTRHSVHCDTCKSVLRETVPDHWKYTVDRTVN
ncbi:MAG: glycoside hydrolase family 3 protein, partial [Armatimonadetes bacterium]|nr:glycoside hydrolase family 3 protein [Anaerolineae bacterium]